MLTHDAEAALAVHKRFIGDGTLITTFCAAEPDMNHGLELYVERSAGNFHAPSGAALIVLEETDIGEPDDKLLVVGFTVGQAFELVEGILRAVASLPPEDVIDGYRTLQKTGGKTAELLRLEVDRLLKQYHEADLARRMEAAQRAALLAEASYD